MRVCSVKFLKAVDGNPVGRVVSGVVLDEMIEKWVRLGLVEVVGGWPAGDTPNQARRGSLAGVGAAPAPVEGGGVSNAAEPSRRAVKAEWRRWLTARGVDYPASATKAELIALWEASARG